MKKQTTDTKFTLDYLSDAELSEDDLHALLDRGALTKSLIMIMLKLCKATEDPEVLYKSIVKDNKWISKYTLSHNSFNKFSKSLIHVFKNVYQVGERSATSQMQMWMIRYGVSYR